LTEDTDLQGKAFCDAGSHQFGESEMACRTCSSNDIDKIEIESNNSFVSDAGFRVAWEPLFGYYCNQCERLTMISLAERCIVCGKVEWLEDMDDEIFKS